MICPPDSDDSDIGEKTSILQGEQSSLIKELAKAREQEACLIIIRGTPQGHRYFLTQPEMVIGRDSSADITVSDQSVSRKHAKVVRQGNDVTIVDLGSANGTAINDRKVLPGEVTKLVKEDMIKLGNSIFKFLPAGELEILFYGNLGSAAHQDALTKIYNRGYLFEALEAEFKRSKALHSDFSILYFDLDHFKRINDNYGHDAGDYVLREVTSMIRTNYLRPKDIFARYGGEEFVVLLCNTNGKTAFDLADKIRNGVETHAFIYEGKRLPVTLSMGVAEIRSDIESSQTLLRTADRALYAAKTGGRNRVVVAS